jgi:SAM-dependent methyltransferase
VKLSQVHARIQDQYESYPFPYFEVLEAEDAQGELGLSLGLDLRLPRAAWKQRPRIWVAGCSTRAAVQIAVQHRHAEVVASDLSKTSLELQRKVADDLGLTNIEFRREDLTRAGYTAEFDYVSCVGVIMILDHPEAGLAALRRALKPGGMAEIMLYATIHRAEAMRCQEILRTIDPQMSARDRMALALRLFSALRQARLGKSHGLVRVARELVSADLFRINDLADFVTHPYERAYDVDGVYDLMKAARLRIRHFKNPALWNPERYVQSKTLGPRIRALAPQERQQLAFLLGTPLLEFFVDDAERPAPVVEPSDQPIDDLRVRPLLTYVKHRFKGRRYLGARQLSRVRRTKRGILVHGCERRPGVSGYLLLRALPPAALGLLDLADGKRTVGEIVTRFAKREGLSGSERPALRALMVELMVPHSRLLAVVG